MRYRKEVIPEIRYSHAYYELHGMQDIAASLQETDLSVGEG
jgi:hypothetical protein